MFNSSLQYISGPFKPNLPVVQVVLFTDASSSLRYNISGLFKPVKMSLYEALNCDDSDEKRSIVSI